MTDMKTAEMRKRMPRLHVKRCVIELSVTVTYFIRNRQNANLPQQSERQGMRYENSQKSRDQPVVRQLDNAERTSSLATATAQWCHYHLHRHRHIDIVAYKRVVMAGKTPTIDRGGSCRLTMKLKLRRAASWRQQEIARFFDENQKLPGCKGEGC